MPFETTTIHDAAHAPVGVSYSLPSDVALGGRSPATVAQSNLDASGGAMTFDDATSTWTYTAQDGTQTSAVIDLPDGYDVETSYYNSLYGFGGKPVVFGDDMDKFVLKIGLASNDDIPEDGISVGLMTVGLNDDGVPELLEVDTHLDGMDVFPNGIVKTFAIYPMGDGRLGYFAYSTGYDYDDEWGVLSESEEGVDGVDRLELASGYGFAPYSTPPSIRYLAGPDDAIVSVYNKGRDDDDSIPVTSGVTTRIFSEDGSYEYDTIQLEGLPASGILFDRTQEGDILVYVREGTEPDDDYVLQQVADIAPFASDEKDVAIPTEDDDLLTLTAGNDVIDALGGNDKVLGGAGDDVIVGGSGKDLLRGSEGSDSLDGGKGYDTLFGGIGNDTLEGGQGFDLLDGGVGDDSLYGGRGKDVLRGSNGNDYMDGGSSKDVMRGGNGDDEMYGGDGKDELSGDDGDDSLFGGDHEDKLYGDDGNDLLEGEQGFDSLYGGKGDDSLFGESGFDRLVGGEGNDYLDGGGGDDTLNGGNGDDHMHGGDGIDALEGGNGDDRMLGGDGEDYLHGGRGEDRLYGGSGKDSIFASNGNDHVRGGGGDDRLFGGSGDDTLFGGDGDDALYGGDGDDVLNGGDGDDRFQFRTTYSGDTNIVRDFSIGDDKIEILDGRVTLTFEDIFLSQEESVAVIQAGETTIRLENVDMNDLSEDDFSFS